MLRVWMLPLVVLAVIVVLRLVGVADHLVVPFACGFAAGFWLVFRRVPVHRDARVPAAESRASAGPPIPPRPTRHAEICPRCGKRKTSSR